MVVKVLLHVGSDHPGQVLSVNSQGMEVGVREIGIGGRDEEISLQVLAAANMNLRKGARLRSISSVISPNQATGAATKSGSVVVNEVVLGSKRNLGSE